MNIRTAIPADTPAIRDVARRSLQASYTLSPQTITTGIEEGYAEDQLEEGTPKTNSRRVSNRTTVSCWWQ